MRHYIFVMILMLLGVATTSYAQRTRKVHGEYTYHAPENVSLEQAKKTALSRAQIQALGDINIVFYYAGHGIPNEIGRAHV